MATSLGVMTPKHQRLSQFTRWLPGFVWIDGFLNGFLFSIPR